MQSNDQTRRGLLRGLISLPLIGGGVTLIGSPTAVAEPVTPRLLQEYAQWLWLEQRRCVDEMLGQGTQDGLWGACTSPGPAWHWHRHSHGLEGGLPVPPSTRAAIVLSAVGCNWRDRGWKEPV
jgi:hypothetical protein